MSQVLIREVFPVAAGAYETAGEASAAIKRKLKQLGVDSGVLRYRTADGDWQFAAVGQGFAEIMPESAILLVATAERPGEIDEERARRAMERAEHRLHTASANPKEHAFSLEAVERAKARLAAKARQRDK